MRARILFSYLFFSSLASGAVGEFSFLLEGEGKILYFHGFLVQLLVRLQELGEVKVFSIFFSCLTPGKAGGVTKS